MDLNVFSCTGRLGADPKMRYTPQGTAVTNFRFAVQLGKEKTLWFDVTAWGKLGENVNQYLTKGKKAAISGRLDIDEWVGDDDQRRTTLKIVANDVRFIGPRSDGGETQQAVKPTADGGKVDELLEEEFEFPI